MGVLAAKEVVSRSVAGETLLVPIGARAVDLDRIFLLNKVGTYLWTLLDGTRTRDDLCAAVRDRFDVPDRRDSDADVDRFLAALLERGLLQ
jgi:hypothetical protein